MTFLLGKLKQMLEHEKALSRTDYLTGVVNGRGFYGIAQRELIRTQRYRRPLTVIYIDLDNFKYVNDYLGHNAGDDVLQVVAKTIRQNVRATDCVTRLGGDEFAILFPETGYDAARTAIRKVHELLLSEMRTKQWPVTFSIGALTYTQPPQTVDEMLRSVDNLMYSAKESGKDRSVHQCG